MRGEMDWWIRGGWGRRAAFVFGAICMAARMAAANVVLIGRNVSMSFDDVEASFASAIKGSGECGILFIAEPLDACSPLTNKVVEGSKSPFVLIIRGGCTFDEKVRNAQNAGFKAAIVYDNQDSDSLIAMAGTPVGIHIPAVFVSRASGETLRKYAGCADVELWIIPVVENSAMSIMAISFISLLAMSAVLATCFFACRHHERHEQPRASNAREFHGMSRRLVKAMPSLIFTSVLEDNCTSQTCAICLEDYNVGDKLRVLPCCHKFHAFCVDSWLTSWRTFCPVCKRDARTSTGDPPASESTPLLSSAASSPFSSFHSHISVSHATQIVPQLSQSPSPRIHSFSSCYMPNSHRSYNNSPALSISRSSADLRHASSQRSRASHLMSPHSAGLLLSSPINSMYASAYIPSSGNASPSYLLGSSSQHSYLRNQNETGSLGYLDGSSSRHSYLRNHNETGSPSCLAGSSSRHLYVTDCTESGPSNYLVGSSSRQSYLRHCSESERSLSALASAQSLPGC